MKLPKFYRTAGEAFQDAEYASPVKRYRAVYWISRTVFWSCVLSLMMIFTALVMDIL